MNLVAATRQETFGRAPVGRDAPLRGADLAVIVPTFNERANLDELVRRIAAALEGVAWEVVIVDDDSPDGTAAAARALYSADARVRCVQRIGRRGLASACVEGMLASGARFIAVMDADLQHDPQVLRTMYDTLARDEAELVIGSRYTEGGSVGEWGRNRVAISRFATRLAATVTPQPVSDTMSGFFALKRETFEACVRRLSSLGFKILLDIIASSRKDLRIKEVPYTFGARVAGESKLSTGVAWEFALLVADKLVGRYVPVRFLAFGLIGGAGVVVHMLVLWALLIGLGQSFALSQSIATAIAILFNFSINNLLTYSGRSLAGRAWVKGLASFYLICGVGALANVGVSSHLHGEKTVWVLAALAGVAVSAVWNYAVSSRYTWKAAS